MYVGQGIIRNRIDHHRGQHSRILDKVVARHLRLTWAVVPTLAYRNGIERFLSETLRPLVGEAWPDVLPIRVNLPGLVKKKRPDCSGLYCVGDQFDALCTAYLRSVFAIIITVRRQKANETLRNLIRIQITNPFIRRIFDKFSEDPQLGQLFLTTQKDFHPVLSAKLLGDCESIDSTNQLHRPLLMDAD